MHIHLINLDRSAGRLTQFCDVNRHLTSVSRVPGVDGAALNIDALVQQGLVTKDILSMYTVGQLGCAMSHISVWDKAIVNDQIITVSEDDAIFNHGFESRAEQLMKGLADWDMIVWGFNFDMFVCFDVLPGVSPCVATFKQDQMRAETVAFQKQSITPQAFKAIWVFGTPCYSVTPRGATAIKKRTLPLRPQVIPLPEAQNIPPFSPSWRTVGIDNSINAIRREINSYVCFPPLVVTKNESETSSTKTSS